MNTKGMLCIHAVFPQAMDLLTHGKKLMKTWGIRENNDYQNGKDKGTYEKKRNEPFLVDGDECGYFSLSSSDWFSERMNNRTLIICSISALHRTPSLSESKTLKQTARKKNLKSMKEDSFNSGILSSVMIHFCHRVQISSAEISPECSIHSWCYENRVKTKHKLKTKLPLIQAFCFAVPNKISLSHFLKDIYYYYCYLSVLEVLNEYWQGGKISFYQSLSLPWLLLM